MILFYFLTNDYLSATESMWILLGTIIIFLMIIADIFIHLDICGNRKYLRTRFILKLIVSI
jgi:hypothetical protein